MFCEKKVNAISTSAVLLLQYLFLAFCSSLIVFLLVAVIYSCSISGNSSGSGGGNNSIQLPIFSRTRNRQVGGINTTAVKKISEAGGRVVEGDEMIKLLTH